jgi:hypothetical protein
MMGLWDFWIYVLIVLVTAAIVMIAVMLMMRALQCASSPPPVITRSTGEKISTGFVSRLQSKVSQIKLPFVSSMRPSAKAPVKSSLKRIDLSTKAKPTAATKAAGPTPYSQNPKSATPASRLDIEAPKASTDLKNNPMPVKSPTNTTKFTAAKKTATDIADKSNPISAVQVESKPGVPHESPGVTRVDQTAVKVENALPEALPAQPPPNKSSDAVETAVVGTASKETPAAPPVEVGVNAQNSVPILELPKLEMSEIVPEEKQAEKPSSDMMNLFEVADEETNLTTDLASTLLDVNLENLNGLSSELVSNLKIMPAVSDNRQQPKDGVRISFRDKHAPDLNADEPETEP